MSGLEPGAVIAGRFRLERPLGQGGMGMVWVAEHIALRTRCALKVIHDEVAAHPDARARFEREAQIAASLKSRHIVQVIDYGVHEGAPYLAMELCEGEDLHGRLVRRGRLAAHETVAIVSQIGRALAKAHGAGLVHRDLKPENVFLAREEDGEIAKVLDFGIAKASTPELRGGMTKTGSLLGTPFYMSPEQAEGTKTVDHRSDLWALGVVAFRCLVGRLPFESEALGDLFMQIMVRPQPVPSAWAPDLPPAFDGWWARAVARDPAARFQSAGELCESLSVALGVTLGAVPAALPLMADMPVATEIGHAPTLATPLGLAAAPIVARTAGSLDGHAQPAPAPGSSGAKWIALGAVGLLLVGGVGAALVVGRGGPERREERQERKAARTEEPAVTASAASSAPPIASASSPAASSAPIASAPATAPPPATSPPPATAPARPLPPPRRPLPPPPPPRRHGKVVIPKPPR